MQIGFDHRLVNLVGNIFEIVVRYTRIENDHWSKVQPALPGI